MTTSTGFQLVSGRIPGERIATDITTSNSSAVSSETEVASINAEVVSGRSYKVTFDTSVLCNTSTSRFSVKIREDSSSGTQLTQRINTQEGGNGGSLGMMCHVEVEYTADATETKTFSATLTMVDGGTATLVANSTEPTYFYVDYIRG